LVQKIGTFSSECAVSRPILIDTFPAVGDWMIFKKTLFKFDSTSNSGMILVLQKLGIFISNLQIKPWKVNRKLATQCQCIIWDGPLDLLSWTLMLRPLTPMVLSLILLLSETRYLYSIKTVLFRWWCFEG
jgi:hypothetical protein